MAVQSHEEEHLPIYSPKRTPPRRWHTPKTCWARCGACTVRHSPSLAKEEDGGDPHRAHGDRTGTRHPCAARQAHGRALRYAHGKRADQRRLAQGAAAILAAVAPHPASRSSPGGGRITGEPGRSSVNARVAMHPSATAVTSAVSAGSTAAQRIARASTWRNVPVTLAATVSDARVSAHTIAMSPRGVVESPSRAAAYPTAAWAIARRVTTSASAVTSTIPMTCAASMEGGTVAALRCRT